MKAIIRNIVGLFRFICLLFLLIFPAPKRAKPRIETPQEKDKYAGIIGPSKPLIPAETKFCPKCHLLVAQVRHTKRGTEIIQNGKALITVDLNVVIQDGKEMRGFPITCPNGHIVRID